MSLAVLGGLIILAHPSKDANLFWPLNVISPLSLLFYLVGHLAFLAHVESGGLRPLAACLGALLLSMTTYDQTAFLPLCWMITPGLFKEGFSPRAKKGVLLALGLVAAFLCYKLFLAPRLFEIPYSKAVLLSPTQFLKTYLGGLNALFGPSLLLGILTGLWRSAASPLVLLLGLALPWLCLSLFRRSDAGQRSAPADSLALLGAAVFLLGYLPVAFSDYVPTPLNHQNRINLAPSLGIVLAALGCVAGKIPMGRGPVVLAACAGVFLAASAGFAKTWAESYRLQCGVVELVERKLPSWPQDKLLLVLLPDRYVDRKAPVFDAYWDISGAIRLATGDARRRAAVVSPRMRFEPDRIIEAGHADLSYGEVVLLDVGRGELSDVAFEDLSRLPPPR
jgi:hypothetical protein